MEKSTKRKIGGAALAAGGAGLALGVPAVSRAELKIARVRTGRIDRQIAAVRSAIPKKPNPETRRISASRINPEHPRDKYMRQQKVKQAHGQIQDLQAKRRKAKRPKVYNKQSALWGAGVGIGAPTSYIGAKQMVDKKMDKHDVAAAYAGGGAGFLGYQGGSLLLKPLEKPAEKRVNASPKLKAQLVEHREKSLPHNAPAGHPAWKDYNRKYPKTLPGARMKRVMGHAVAGKTGGAITLGVTGASALGAVKYNQHRRESKVKKSMDTSAFGIDHGYSEVEKKSSYWDPKDPKTKKTASGGRRALAYMGGPFHGAIAGKSGKKLRAGGNEAIGILGGNVAGSAAGSALGGTRGAAIGGLAGAVSGSQMAQNRNQRKGYLKPEK